MVKKSTSGSKAVKKDRHPPMSSGGLSHTTKPTRSKAAPGGKDIALKDANLLIENEGLKIEVQQRNAEIAEALEQQTATSDILRVIAQSPTDIQPVLDVIAENARRLCNANLASVYRTDGQMIDEVASTDLSSKILETAREVSSRSYPARLGRDSTLSSRAILDRAIVHIPDMENEADLPEITRRYVKAHVLRSVLFVPLMREREAIGCIGVGRRETGAFTENQIALLQTFASQAVIAIENVRLFTETQRLLKETEERNAELAVINSVQGALAAKLDMQAIYDLVGDKLHDIFQDAQTVDILMYDPAAGLVHPRYVIERNQRLTVKPWQVYGFRKHVIATGLPLVINHDVAQQSLEFNNPVVVGEAAKSLILVPMLVGGKVRGVISLQNLDRENAFSDSDLRLITTLANSMSVALENARLFNEAQEARAAADKANATKSAFLSNMSHELRTPLNAIIGFTRIVRRKAEGSLPEKQTENLDKVLASAEHLLGLINTVLDIAKIEAGRMDVLASNFNVSALADQCANLASTLLKPNVTLEKQVDENIGLVYSDQDKIKQIVLNLLSNAAKFTHEGRILLHVEKEKENIHIHVADSGIGISEEAIGRVFEEFQQADTSTTRKYGGTGLGLSISRNLARLLGGDLTAVSELGKGSIFTLTIPMKYGSKPASSSVPAPDSAKKAESHSHSDPAKKTHPCH